MKNICDMIKCQILNMQRVITNQQKKQIPQNKNWQRILTGNSQRKKKEW